jgi:thiol-disulfide isomerase/thioredoxin
LKAWGLNENRTRKGKARVVALLFLVLAAASNLTPINEEQLSAVIREHQGQVVLVNFWATWCIPCREEILVLVRLYEERQGEGLTIISISIDEPEKKGHAGIFLEESHANFPAYIVNTEDLEAFLGVMDPTWTGAIPATFIFNRQGEKAFSHVGQLSYEELTAQLDGVR